MLPSPTFCFTIPSLHDGTPLDCRVYHPTSSKGNGERDTASWRIKGAIIAHPYAPLGGCCDDPVVDCVAAEVLQKGCVIGTFNFRGAGNSKGRTSWTAKAELADYCSFAGFFIHYLHQIESSELYAKHYSSRGTLSPIQPSKNSPGQKEEDSPMFLILGGYSYGSMITSQLPRTDEILERFSSVAKQSTEAEIRTRASQLSSRWNREERARFEVRRARAGRTRSSLPGSPQSVVLCGDDTDTTRPRLSRDSRRSLDSVRRSIDFSRRSLNSRRQAKDKLTTDDASIEEKLEDIHIPLPKTHYLLVSPLLPPISMFVTFFSDVGLRQLALSFFPSRRKNTNDSADDMQLVEHPTLAIFGDNDMFTSHRKLKCWADDLSRMPTSKFSYKDVQGAGHFWHEKGASKQLSSAVGAWVLDCLDS
ncbi:MAG: hypothetical protein M1829_005808 [Trizodia sp. TS-e1964]|nr:MAG: hypothetical protein M1829_005808 [Trizodia sp. TS-e1964]